MEHPLPARRATAAALAAVALAAATACGGAQGDDSDSGDPRADEAQRLHKAQLVQFEEAKVVPQRSEAGTYAELSTTKQTDKLRKTAELDKPQCMDATNQWADLPEVRKAPTSLATFARGDDTITHTLIEVPEETAEEVVSASPPEGCDSYKATIKDGSTTSYRLQEVEVEEIADGSRAFAVETAIGGEKVWLYRLVYRNGGYLGTTAVLGPDSEKDYRETVSAFSRAAVEREDKLLA
ncbi:hypothetical protein [Streptomonospora wellingtoniae]|uniref:Lipoprotein n=1 Tax=Streptomonospora wellingtoniae TaxID=3075544 RepID=A0ABU2KRF9_9ACTN|nr:hypothetical protein [Streptomonospora sp. DSM 45055]MDT0301833.1 hypothetical protein [Streptomonospora sp. DSM 45055]